MPRAGMSSVPPGLAPAIIRPPTSGLQSPLPCTAPPPTWNGKILPVVWSKATASASSTTLRGRQSRQSGRMMAALRPQQASGASKPGRRLRSGLRDVRRGKHGLAPAPLAAVTARKCGTCATDSAAWEPPTPHPATHSSPPADAGLELRGDELDDVGVLVCVVLAVAAVNLRAGARKDCCCEGCQGRLAHVTRRQGPARKGDGRRCWPACRHATAQSLNPRPSPAHLDHATGQHVDLHTSGAKRGTGKISRHSLAQQWASGRPAAAAPPPPPPPPQVSSRSAAAAARWRSCRQRAPPGRAPRRTCTRK